MTKYTCSPSAYADNARRQAKRLADALSIPLSLAKDILAGAVYRCDSWAEFQRRLRCGSIAQHIAQIGSLPHSLTAQAYFLANLKDLAEAMGQTLLTSRNRYTLCLALLEMVGLPPSLLQLANIFPTAATNEWKPSRIGPDPDAVLECSAIVFGVQMRVHATRVYAPRHAAIERDLANLDPSILEPKGAFRIMWEKPAGWYGAARAFAADDSDDGPLWMCPPEVRMSDEMLQHEQAFNAALTSFGLSGEYGDHGEEFLPVSFGDRGPYLIFGRPIEQANSAFMNSAGALDIEDWPDSCSSVVALGKDLVTAEWISFDRESGRHLGEFTGHWESVHAGPLNGIDPEKVLVRSSEAARAGVLFLRPTTHFELEQALSFDPAPLLGQAQLILKTDHSATALQLIKIVAERGVMVSKRGAQADLIVVLESDSVTGLPRDLSINIHIESPKEMRMIALTGRRSYERSGGRSSLVMTIAPELLNVVDLLGARDLRNALEFGLILRRPDSILDQVAQPARRCEQLLEAPQDIVERISRPIPKDAILKFSYTSFERK